LSYIAVRIMPVIIQQVMVFTGVDCTLHTANGRW